MLADSFIEWRDNWPFEHPANDFSRKPFAAADQMEAQILTARFAASKGFQAEAYLAK